MPSLRGTRGLGVTIAGPLHYFSAMPLNNVDTEIVEAWAKLEGKVRPTSARLAWRMLKVFFQWCYESKTYRDLIQPQNPAKTKKSGEALGKAKAKRDDLEAAQLQGWFDAVQKLGNPTISAYLQTLLRSGARPGEVLEMRWEDINWRWESIVIRDKMDGERTIPLTPFVAHLLAALPRRNDYVFSSALKEVAIIAKPHLPHKLACDAAGLQGLTLHGLRRSFASLAEQTEAPGGWLHRFKATNPRAPERKVTSFDQWIFYVNGISLSKQ
ncbi:tyrosine-type recombinase/integrase [Glaciimonas sp. CA11.2]|uniref:tyrosine-type recombinase/integrase n=2 Tax=Glaciimonas sp. CA11.2 TaxID=3048601 RepID=UPI002AB33362|nr:tyrosine-type recombinase/integrase [Glaciimonas sp. CA11.2]MDY7546898.1 tyrosine-type recombinase/integrase [Glaciimonas sp. CA11.2]